MIDNYSRYQKGLTLSTLKPSIKGLCACGCGRELTGRQTKWASSECRDNAYVSFAIVKGDNEIIRQELFKRDKGFCCMCGVYDDKWESDHVIPVIFGGSGCALLNFQTLCRDCHKEKTKLQSIWYSKLKQFPDRQPLSFVACVYMPLEKLNISF